MSIEPTKKTPRDLNISLQLITKYQSNGQKKSEGYYEEQEPVGDHTTWYENGNKKHETIALSEITDLTTEWYQNGQIRLKEYELIILKLDYGHFGMKMATRNQKAILKERMDV